MEGGGDGSSPPDTVAKSRGVIRHAKSRGVICPEKREFPGYRHCRRPQTRRLDGQITSATARKRGGYRNLGGEVGGRLLLEPGMAAFKMVGRGGAYFKMILGQSSKWIWGKLQNGCGPPPLTHYCSSLESQEDRDREDPRTRRPEGNRGYERSESKNNGSLSLNACCALARSTARGVVGSPRY